MFGVMLCVIALLTSASGVAIAGQGQEASIIGQVTDESGGVLPGVVVTATSPALQVPQVTGVSDQRGEYRLTPLPLGTYAVQYQLSGFQTIRREGIRLTAGFTARLDVVMAVSAVAETVTVTGASPVVDVRSTATRTQLTRETLEVIPTSRLGMISVLSQAPGVRSQLDVGGTTLRGSSNPELRAFGQSGGSWTLLEGVINASPKDHPAQAGNVIDYNAIEEATIQTVGSPADAPTRGVQASFFIKSGSNDFHGGGFWADTPTGWQSDNLTDALRAQGVRAASPLADRSDKGADLGGRILRDKLWFYHASHVRRLDVGVVNAFRADGSPFTNDDTNYHFTQKVSYQPHASHRLVGFYQYTYGSSLMGITQFTSPDYQEAIEVPNHLGKGEWQVTAGNRVLSLQYGRQSFQVRRPGGFSNDVATFDQITRRESGNNWSNGRTSTEGRHHTKGVLNWYKPDFIMGNHDFKVGVDYFRARADQETVSRGASGNYRLVFRDGIPFQIQARNNPVTPRTLVHYLGTYVQDSWAVTRRLTLNLGARYAHENGFVPEQCRVAAEPPLDVLYPAECFAQVQFKKFNSVLPRLHAAYDVTGDGNTVIKGGWARFADMRYTSSMNMANLNTDLLSNFGWRDLNGNRSFDAGEVNFDVNGSDFVSTTVVAGDAFSGAIPNPNEKQPKHDEFSLSIERQLIPDLAVRLTGVYARHTNVYRLQNNLRPYEVYTIPVTLPDPGPDGRVGSGDDPGTLVTYHEYPVALRGREFQQPMLINDPKATRSYRSLEVAASKRMTNRWQFMTSFSATKSRIPYVDNIGGTAVTFMTSFDPNAEINAADNTWEWLGRASGAYVFPGDLQVSANYEHRSGLPFARTVSFRGGRTIPSITLRVEPIGTRRQSNLNLTDVRIQKSFRLRQGHRASVMLNVYNVLNSSAVITRVEQSGPNFLAPTRIVLPRSVEWGVRYTF